MDVNTLSFSKITILKIRLISYGILYNRAIGISFPLKFLFSYISDGPFEEQFMLFLRIIF